MGSQGGWGSSKEFLDLVKAIGEAKSKAEEERIVVAEIETLKKRIGEPDVPRKKMKEYIIRLVYVEMLGHDASFGYIQAVKMTHDDNLLLKKSGYLAVTLFLNEDHDLIILIVNTIQKDLKSDNYLVCCAALTAVCKLINEETIPAVLPQVVELLTHPKEAVRKKAVMAVHRFYQRAPNAVSHVIPKFRQILCDKDPSVMSAALCALFDLVTADVRSFKNLTASFVSILKQVVEHRLPKSYDYLRTPAPFVQIKLLKILALLGAGDKHTSENMYSVLADVLKRSDATTNIGNAILYECICTITTIHGNTRLLEAATELTSRFLKSENHNLKYMGIDALGRVIKINPEFAEEHQLAVIDCLEDPDDTLKRKTLDLLYKMTKSSNVEVIVERMIGYMRTLNDAHNKTEIASRIIELAERFAPSNQWFIQTMNQVFELAGELVPPKVAHDLMRLLAEGAGEDDEDADSLLRSSAVESYLQVLGEPKLPSILLQVICWVLGEYGTADGTHSAVDIIGKLCDVAEAHPGDDAVKGYAITAITKVCAFEISAGKTVQLIPEVFCKLCRQIGSLEAAKWHQRVARCLMSCQPPIQTDLQQRAYELQAFLGLSPDIATSVMPMDASCEDIEVDKNLAFLNKFVESALTNGARPYIPESERLNMGSGMSMFVGASTRDQNEPSTHALRFEAYEMPTLPSPLVASGSASTSSLLPDFEEHKAESQRSLRKQFAADKTPDLDLLNPDSTRLQLDGVHRKWGRLSYSSPLSSSTSNREKERADNGLVPDVGSTHREAPVSSTSSVYESRNFEKRKPQPEVSVEKQRLAASLFGGPARKVDTNGRSSGSGVAKLPKPLVQKGSGEKSRSSPDDTSKPNAAVVVHKPPPPADLLDLSDGDPTVTVEPSSDPFKQLEDLLECNSTAAPAVPLLSPRSNIDLMSLFNSTPLPGGPSGSDLVSTAAPNRSDSLTAGFSQGLMDVNGLPLSPLIGLTGVAPAGVMAGQTFSPSVHIKKGLSIQGSLQKDAASRQVGVTPTVVNPDLFKDLLG